MRLGSVRVEAGAGVEEGDELREVGVGAEGVEGLVFGDGSGGEGLSGEVQCELGDVFDHALGELFEEAGLDELVGVRRGQVQLVQDEGTQRAVGFFEFLRHDGVHHRANMGI